MKLLAALFLVAAPLLGGQALVYVQAESPPRLVAIGAHPGPQLRAYEVEVNDARVLFSCSGAVARRCDNVASRAINEGLPFTIIGEAAPRVSDEDLFIIVQHIFTTDPKP